MNQFEKADVLDHVLRTPLPWRHDEMTECGRELTKVAQTINRDQLHQRVQQWGRQRTSMTVCMTCAQRASYAGSWETDPIAVLHRELERTRSAPSYRGPETEQAQRMAHELHAIAALIAAHRNEFDNYLHGIEQAPSLAQARTKRRTRRSSC